MITNDHESFTGNNLVDDIQQKVKSLMSLLSEIKQLGQNDEIDQSLCDDIYSYIDVVQTDCQKVLNSDKYNQFSKTDDTIQNFFGRCLHILHYSIFYFYYYVSVH